MEVRNIQQLRDISNLSRSIFQADVPEKAIRELPAQTLYQVLRYNGLDSSIELIELAGVEQVRLLLDFDLWTPDGIDEEKLWNWLELTSEDDEIIVLQKVVGSLDLKIVALLINRYLEITQNEEATDAPPGPLFFTPDKGFTWIRVLCEDQRKHFLLSKLLAFLFESNADIFYQLMATKVTTTPAVLEEEALNDKNKRLAAEGLPDPEFAAEVTGFLSVADGVKKVLENSDKSKNLETVVIETLARISDKIEPLTSAIEAQENLEEVLSELSLIVNSAIVRFKADHSDNEQISLIASQCQGALNIGLEVLSKKSSLSSEQILKNSGLQLPFRVGLTLILDLAKKARKYETSLTQKNLEIEQATKSLLELIKKPFPALPIGLSKHKTDFELIEPNHLMTTPAPFRYYEEIEELRSKLAQS